MPVRFAYVLIAAAGGLLLAGCNVGSTGSGERVEVTQRVQRGVTPGQRTLVIDSYNGDITLQDTSAREADLTFVKRARAESREEARRLLEKIRIEERGGKGEFVYQVASSVSGRTSVDVRGSVPQNTRLRLHVRNGDVALSGLQGPLDVNDENGNIRIGGAAQTTRAETRNGSIEAGMRRVPPEAEVRLRTANGDLELTLPGSASADVEARTSAGTIDVQGLRFSGRELSQNGAGARFEGELGEGAATVRLRTENGDIALRQGVVRRLPDVAGDTSQAARPDTSGRDSLLIPPAGPGGARRDTTSPGRGGQQQAVPNADTPPPLLRRPKDTAASGSPPGRSADTSGSPQPLLRQDTTQMF